MTITYLQKVKCFLSRVCTGTCMLVPGFVFLTQRAKKVKGRQCVHRDKGYIDVSCAGFSILATFCKFEIIV